MVTADDIQSKKAALSVIGLGYVGLPVAVSFAKVASVVGFDVNSAKIAAYKNGIDVTRETGDDEVRNSGILFTDDNRTLRDARFHIIAVPTPILPDKTPDLSFLEFACRLLGQQLMPGSIVVVESTVYPGVTEEICAPILERESGLACGVDFKIGYSPERINPSDRSHSFESITKVVSGMDGATLAAIAETYALVVEGGIYRAPDIRVAEAAKVIENSQRDINIAFVNELAVIFGRMGIDTQEVLKAASTKWNFLRFSPGLVGGHCIGIDPYYLAHCAELHGHHPDVILAGRRINDGMGKYVATETVKLLIRARKEVIRAKVGILGLTFKENCPDIRNTRVVDIIDELSDYGITPLICDPLADRSEARKIYGISLSELCELQNLDAVIVAVGHDAFLHADIASMLGKGGVVADVKGILLPSDGHLYWRL